MNTRRFQHTRIATTSNRTNNEQTPIVPVLLVQTSINETNNSQNTSLRRLNPKNKRNLRANRRPTGIRPDDLSTVSTQSDDSDDNQNVDESSTTRNHPEPNETIVSAQPMFTVSRVQSSFDKLSINRPDNPNYVLSPASTSNIYANSVPNNRFRTEEFILRRQPSDDDSSTIKTRQLEERLMTLESLVYEKDMLIHDLQRKLDQTIRDLSNAEGEIYNLHKEKLTLIKAFSTIQETKSSSSSYVNRN